MERGKACGHGGQIVSSRWQSEEEAQEGLNSCMKRKFPRLEIVNFCGNFVFLDGSVGGNGEK